MDAPHFFVDEMVSGHFRSFRHEHVFEALAGKMIMYDTIRYETPFGWFGKVFDKVLLRRHLQNLIETRNAAIKSLAESH